MEIIRFLFIRWSTFFILSGIIFIPFSFKWYSIQSQAVEFLFGDLVNLIANFFDIDWQLNDFSSDSKRLYILICLLIFICFIISLLSFNKKIFPISWERFEKTIRLITAYYLAWILLKYGFDKIFKCQFYLPEPNILYSKVGDLDKDILFWSSMGSSYAYSIFMGMSEIITSILLLFAKTRKIGIVIAIGVLINVLAINLSFDISVKLFSCFLLLIVLYLFSPFAFKLWQFLSNKELKTENNLSENIQCQTRFPKHKWFKLTIIFLILIESLSLYVKSQNFNDDKFPRPLLHGAYAVEEFIQGKDTLIGEENVIKNIFIHRDNYLIFQFKNEEMIDFKMEINPQNKSLILFDNNQNKKIYSIDYNPTRKRLKLFHIGKYETEVIICKESDWKKMPLMQPLFHWSVD